MRITAGKYKNKKIATAYKGMGSEGFKPITEMARQAVFNVINSAPYLEVDFLEKANVLDVCCGSGALGLEAISRGAKLVTFIDKDPSHIKLCKLNVEHIFTQNEPVKFITSDAVKLASTDIKYNLVFIDPPYPTPEVITATLNALTKGNWFAPDNLVVIKHSKKDVIPLPLNFEVHALKTYGASTLTFCKAIIDS